MNHGARSRADAKGKVQGHGRRGRGRGRGGELNEEGEATVRQSSPFVIHGQRRIGRASRTQQIRDSGPAQLPGPGGPGPAGRRGSRPGWGGWGRRSRSLERLTLLYFISRIWPGLQESIILSNLSKLKVKLSHRKIIASEERVIIGQGKRQKSIS